MRHIVLGLVALVVAGLTATAALGASPHFTKSGSPKCTISGTTSDRSRTVVCSGELAGLGNEDVVVSTSVSGEATFTCVNQGGNAAPGQNRVLVGPSVADTSFPANQIKNGRLAFATNPNTLTAPSTVSGAEAGCPNENWTGQFATLSITNVTLTASQGGEVIFTCSRSGQSLSGTITFTRSECTFA